MEKLIYSSLLCFLWLAGLHAEDTVSQNLETCEKFLNSYCGSMNWQECTQKQNKKSAQVAQCVQFIVKNHQKISVENNLAPTFKTLLKDLKNDHKDNAECIKTANAICGDGIGFNECLEKNAGSFPSYCRGAVKDNLNKMQAAYNNDVELKSCTDIIIQKCKPHLKEQNNTSLTMAQEKAMYAGYQKCLQGAIPKTRACQGLVNANKNNQTRPSVQKITN